MVSDLEKTGREAKLAADVSDFPRRRLSCALKPILGLAEKSISCQKGFNEQDLHLFLPRNPLLLRPAVAQGTGVREGIPSLSIPEKPMRKSCSRPDLDDFGRVPRSTGGPGAENR